MTTIIYTDNGEGVNYSDAVAAVRDAKASGRPFITVGGSTSTGDAHDAARDRACEVGARRRW